jgi:hypothetical protein
MTREFWITGRRISPPCCGSKTRTRATSFSGGSSGFRSPFSWTSSTKSTYPGKLDQVAQYAQVEGAEERGVSLLDVDVASDGGIPHLTTEGLLEREAPFRQVHDREQIRADLEGLLSDVLQEEQPEVGRGRGQENEVRPVPGSSTASATLIS